MLCSSRNDAFRDRSSILMRIGRPKLPNMRAETPRVEVTLIQGHGKTHGSACFPGNGRREWKEHATSKMCVSLVLASQEQDNCAEFRLCHVFHYQNLDVPAISWKRFRPPTRQRPDPIGRRSHNDSIDLHGKGKRSVDRTPRLSASPHARESNVVQHRHMILSPMSRASGGRMRTALAEAMTTTESKSH